ncbi:polysaccharide deacetylase family protein [Phytoactinopolyspora mesophila]|nr:polysaccharide deacetylase family protein [Phytoactinopolyspora mesophila]
MKLSMPLLGVLVVIVIALSAANSRSADESGAGTEASARHFSTLPEAVRATSGPLEFGGASVPALRGGNSVALTFDDGPHPTYTPQVLDLLAEHEVRAVFCVVGVQVRQHPELVRRIVDDGHTLCNHTENHDSELAKRSPEKIDEEIAATAGAIAEAAGDAPVRFFRQPARYVAPEVAPIAEEHGLTLLDWTVDSQDWKRPGASEIVARVADGLQPGAVVLLHDGGGDRSQTVTALDEILVLIEESGYRATVPVSS